MNPFDEKAASWDANPFRRELAERVFACMSRFVSWNPDWVALDAGAGTGLLSLALASRVQRVIAVDASRGMLDVLARKAAGMPVEIHACTMEDLDLPDESVDVVVSSMALHHVPDVSRAFSSFLRILKPGGRLLAADLDTEDGSFHSDNTGVYHYGFDRTALADKLRVVGFASPVFKTVWEFDRTSPAGGVHRHSVFCVHALKEPALR